MFLVVVETEHRDKAKGQLGEGELTAKKEGWPATLDVKVEIRDSEGNPILISFEEYLRLVNNNNRGGT